MTKLYIKQKVFSLGETYSVKDENGTDKYFVKGEIFSFGQKVHVMVSNGVEVAFISGKVFSFMPTYNIQAGSRSIEIRKKFTFFSQSFEISGSNMELNGDFFAHDFSLTENSRVIMNVSKEFFTWGDSYALDILDDDDELLCLSIALCIDLALHEGDKK